MKRHTGYRNFIKRAIARTSGTATYTTPGKQVVETKEDPAVIAEIITICKDNGVNMGVVAPVAVAVVKPAADELEVYSLAVKGNRVYAKDLQKICDAVSARSSGKRDMILFRGAEFALIPAAILKPMAKLFDQVMDFELAKDAVIFRSTDRRSKTVINAAALDKVGKLIAVDVMAL